jgi:hypothetical protein
MANYTVRIVFNKGISGSEYIFPLVQSITEPKEGTKDTIIAGTRGDGSLVIPGGKKSQEITIKGKLWSETGYADLMTKMNEMKLLVDSNVATITKEYWNPNHTGGGDWETTWSYTVKRIEPITFADSFQIDTQDYTAIFYIIAY